MTTPVEIKVGQRWRLPAWLAEDRERPPLVRLEGLSVVRDVRGSIQVIVELVVLTGELSVTKHSRVVLPVEYLATAELEQG